VEEHKPQNCEDEINLLDLLIVLAKHKKLIIGGTLGAGIVMAVISLIMTPVYLAETKIYIPQSSTGLSSQLLSQIGPMVGLTGTSKAPNELYIELLKSRPVRERIVKRFDLITVYGLKTPRQAQGYLMKNIKIKQDMKSGVITLGIQDTDPTRCTAIANAYIEEFRNQNKVLALTEASQRRLFFEEQLKEAKAGLSNAEEAMQMFQEKSGAINIDSQAAAIIDAISQLRAQIAVKEVQTRVMRTYSTPNNPDVRRAEEELSSLREQVRRLEAKKGDDSVIVPTGSLPSAGKEYVRRMRDLKFNEKLFELLLAQYQSAKLDEARDAVVVQVLERSEPPGRMVKPKRIQMVILALIVGLFIASFIAFMLELKEKVNGDPQNRDRIAALKRYLSPGKH